MHLDCAVLEGCAKTQQIFLLVLLFMFLIGRRMENPLTENATLPGYCMRECVSCAHGVFIPGMFIWKHGHISETALTLTLNSVKSKW